MELPRRILYAATALAVTLVIGTSGFMLVDGYPFADAAYMTVTTVFTVGYGEIRPLSPAGRIFNMVLIVFGGITFLAAVAAITQTVIELELNQALGKRRTRKMIEKLKDHYIICGYGRVGRGAAEELKTSGTPFVIIDNNEDRVERAMRNGMLAVLADCTRDESLHECGIMRAKGLIATLGADADNLFVVLSARTLNPLLQVAARASEEEASAKLRRAGADIVFAPYTITGNRMAQALLRPHVHQFIDFTTRSLGPDVGLEQVLIAPESRLINQTLQQVKFRSVLGVIVLAIRKHNGEMLFNPPAEALIEAGDFLIVMGKNMDLRQLEDMVSARV